MEHSQGRWGPGQVWLGVGGKGSGDRQLRAEEAVSFLPFRIQERR